MIGYENTNVVNLSNNAVVLETQQTSEGPDNKNPF